MNNGNLLQSLLGMASANPAVTKTSAAKARAESAEKFQQTLDQVRPEIAARKPAARKENPPAEAARPAAKPLDKPVDKPSAVREDTNAPANTRADAQDMATKSPEKSDSVREAAADEVGAEGATHTPFADGQPQTLAEKTLTGDGELQLGNGERQSGDDLPLALDSLLLAAPSSPVDGEFDDIVVASDLLLHNVKGQPVLLDESVIDGERESSLDIAGTDSAVLATQPVAMALGSPLSLLPEQAASTAADNPSPLVATTLIAPGQGPSATVTRTGVDVAAAAWLAESAFPAASPVGEPVLEDAEVAVEMPVDDNAVADAGENPDFLLLNSKAALNKLAEATMAAASQDSPAPAADLAKPTAVNAAVETLTRLADAQSPAARAFVVQTGVPVTVGTPQWSQAVGDKVLWLAAQNVSSAEIRLDPPELGPMQVKVSVNQDQASVTFTSPHPAVREALDQQLNRLREMFSEQGLNLVNVDVSDRSFAQQEREQEESANKSAKSGLEEEELAPVAITQAISMRLVDHYA